MAFWFTLPKNEGKAQIPNPSSQTEGWIEQFINDLGFINKKVTKRGLIYGYKFDDIKRKTDIPGISVIVMPTWYMFEHFYSEEKARLTTFIYKNKDLCKMANLIIEYLNKYQTTYGQHVDYLWQSSF